MAREMRMKITRGTTPTLNFVLPFNYDSVEDVYVTFSQNGEKILQLTSSEIEVVPLLAETENSEITDNNYGDEIVSNNVNFSGTEADEQSYIGCTIHLTQEQSLGFTFWPAAEKNIAIVQFKVLIHSEDSDPEVYISNPVNFRIYGDLDGEVRGISNEEGTE